MNLKLDKSLVGKIQKENFKSNVLREVKVTFGIVGLSLSVLLGLKVASNINDNREKDRIISTIASNIEGDNYSEELTRFLDLSFDDNYVEDIDELCSYLKEVNNYRDEDTDAIEKHKIKNKLLNNYYNIEDTSIELLKKKIAAENNVRIDDITIYVGREGCYAKIDGTRRDLEKDELRFAQSIASFQDYNVDNLRNSQDEVFNDYLDNLENVVVDSVKLIDAEEDYKLPGFLGYLR